MMQMVIETYCAEIEGLKQKLEERDRKIAKLEYENEKLHTLTDLQEANVNTMHENTMKLRKEIEQCEERVSAAYELGYKESKSTLETKNAELQKQVDMLKANQVIECHGMLKGCDMVKQAVKDTAKEILQEGKYCLSKSLKDWIKEHYGVEVQE